MRGITNRDNRRIGELADVERTGAGHRSYSEADVRRLYQVVALRSLGVPLARIARALEGDGFTLKDAVTAQLEAVDAELLHARRLRRRLERILEVLERSDDPSVSELTQIMEVMRMHETYYPPEQLAQLEAGASPYPRQEDLDVGRRMVRIDEDFGDCSRPRGPGGTPALSS